MQRLRALQRFESERIGKHRGPILDVGVSIQASSQPNRITTDVSSETCVVIPRHVVREVCFLVEVLARQS